MYMCMHRVCSVLFTVEGDVGVYVLLSVGTMSVGNIDEKVFPKMTLSDITL